jgi:hypothetical protein
MIFLKSGIRWSQPYWLPTLCTDTPCPEAERLVTTVNVTPKTTNSNSLLPNTASNVYIPRLMLTVTTSCDEEE